jgi:hypothetical protein
MRAIPVGANTSAQTRDEPLAPETAQSGEAENCPKVNSQQGNVRPMWGSVVGLAFLTALNPLRLGLAILMISRSRPVQNLFVYWLGCLTGCIPAVVVPLTLLHLTPMFKPFAGGLASSPMVQHTQLGVGVVALSVAAVLATRLVARRRQPAELSASGGNTTTMVMDSKTPKAIQRLLGGSQDATEGDSAFRRLLRRIQNAWENGSLWVAYVIGVGFGGTEPDVGLVLLTIIVSSGATLGAQVSAAIVFVIGTLGVAEITLVSYLAAPARTQAVLRPVHDWALAHRRQILVTLLAVIGVSLVAGGLGNF